MFLIGGFTWHVSSPFSVYPSEIFLFGAPCETGSEFNVVSECRSMLRTRTVIPSTPKKFSRELYDVIDRVDVDLMILPKIDWFATFVGATSPHVCYYLPHVDSEAHISARRRRIIHKLHFHPAHHSFSCFAFFLLSQTHSVCLPSLCYNCRIIASRYLLHKDLLLVFLWFCQSCGERIRKWIIFAKTCTTTKATTIMTNLLLIYPPMLGIETWRRHTGRKPQAIEWITVYCLSLS